MLALASGALKICDCTPGIEPQILKAKDVRQKLQINFTQAFNHLQSCLVSRRAREREWHILHHVLPVNVFICLDCLSLICDCTPVSPPVHVAEH